MSYSKPKLKKMEVSVKVNSDASERSSCEGGHCVRTRRTRYSQDH